MSVCAPLPEWLVNLYALYSLEWEESDVEEDNVFDLCCAKCGVKLIAGCYVYPGVAMQAYLRLAEFYVEDAAAMGRVHVRHQCKT